MAFLSEAPVQGPLKDPLKGTGAHREILVEPADRSSLRSASWGVLGVRPSCLDPTLEGRGSIETQGFSFLGRGSYCKEVKWLES